MATVAAAAAAAAVAAATAALPSAAAAPGAERGSPQAVNSLAGSWRTVVQS